jgi:hypothetical protein
MPRDTAARHHERRPETAYVGLRNEDQMEVFAVTRIGNPDCYSNYLTSK